MYQVLGAAPASRWSQHRPRFEETTESFHDPSESELREVHENRLRLVEARVGETLSRIASRSGSLSPPGSSREPNFAVRDVMSPGTRTCKGVYRNYLLRWCLVPAISQLHGLHPQLRLTLLADNRILSLASAEADIALRFVRPDRGDLVSSRVSQVAYGLFVSADLETHEAMPWLGLAGSLRSLPEELYAQELFQGRQPIARFEDLESLARAVVAGLGVAVLPKSVGRYFGGMREVSARCVGGASAKTPPPRSLWLVTHRARQRVPKVRAVGTWLLATLEGLS